MSSKMSHSIEDDDQTSHSDVDMEEGDFNAARILASMSDSSSFASSSPSEEDKRQRLVPGAPHAAPLSRSMHNLTVNQKDAICQSQGRAATRNLSSESYRISMLDEKSTLEHQSKPGSSFKAFNRLTQYEDLLLYIATQHFEPRELIILYRISRSFQYAVNSHMTNYILCSARRWARLTHFRPSNGNPNASNRAVRIDESDNPQRSRLNRKLDLSASERALGACGTEPTVPGVYSPHDITTLFPFHNYSHLCIKDPTTRRLSHFSAQAKSTQDGQSSSNMHTEKTRDVPSLRYLRFLLFRARTISSVLASLLKEGHRLPIVHTPAVLAKIWYTMDLPLNASRLALLRNKTFWTDTDLYVAHMFFIKLDMCLSDPVDWDGEMDLRKVLLAHRSLSTLSKVLQREEGRTMIEILQLWAKVVYRPSQEHRQENYSVLGVPCRELGVLGVEAWGLPVKEGLGIAADPYSRKQLLRPDQLVVYESLTRGLPLHEKVVDMMVYGYVDYVTGKNLPKTEEERQEWLKEERKLQAEASAAQMEDGTTGEVEDADITEAD